MTEGQPHDCVTVARPRQSGIGHVAQSSRVAVTVGQPVCLEGVGGGPEGKLTVVMAGELALPLGAWARTPVLHSISMKRKREMERDKTYTARTKASDFIVRPKR